jgi:hypothetical protein
MWITWRNLCHWFSYITGKEKVKNSNMAVFICASVWKSL